MNTHFMKLATEPFEKIINREKIYELRLFDDKRQKVRIGDEIIFTELNTGGTCKARVVDILTFDSFATLYASLPLKDCGYRDDELQTASPRDMEKYYSEEEQRQFGVVAFKIELI